MAVREVRECMWGHVDPAVVAAAMADMQDIDEQIDWDLDRYEWELDDDDVDID